jgi:hypothetical protein
MWLLDWVRDQLDPDLDKYAKEARAKGDLVLICRKQPGKQREAGE